MKREVNQCDRRKTVEVSGKSTECTETDGTLKKSMQRQGKLEKLVEYERKYSKIANKNGGTLRNY